MKSYIILILLTFIQHTNTPVGCWKYLPDTSIVEIINRNGTLTGSLLSSRNPNRKSGNEIVRNIEYREGEWRGEFYLYKKNRWVDAVFQVKGDHLLIEYKYGFLTFNLHFHRV